MKQLLSRATRALLIVIAMLAAACWSVAVAPSAGAEDPGCPSGEQMVDGPQMTSLYCYSWRSTYVIDPGRHQEIGYDHLWRYRDMFNAHGFEYNWLWYSHMTHRTFRPGPDSGVKWASCKNRNGGTSNPYPAHELPPTGNGNATGLCTDQIYGPERQTSTLLNDFRQHPVTLSVFSYGSDGAFIARGCGNFSVKPTQNPVPKVSGTKYHDRNRNGVRDAGEEGLAGWQVRLWRDASSLNPPQGTGFTGLTTTTGPDGRYSFDLWNHGPGIYRVEELQQTGWVQTAAPGQVHVGFGVGSHEFGGNDLGNVEDTADVVKVAWNVVSAPETVHARDTATVRVKATIANNGPAPVVDVVDTMTATGPSDCVIAPPEQAARRRLTAGETVEIEFEVAVTCADPSFHPLVFKNTVQTTTPGVTDPSPSNNTLTTGVTIAVIDDADVGVQDVALDCPSRIDVNTPFTCTGSATAVNSGPYGPASTDVSLSLAPPGDCTVVGARTRTFTDLALAYGEARPLASTWELSCANRSFHPMALSASAVLDHIHVQDLNPANDGATAGDTVEVFEPADLSIVEPMRIACGGRLPTITSFTCDVRVTIANAGPATSVATKTMAALTAPPDCVVTPTPQDATATLDAGGSTELTFRYDVECSLAVLHTLLATATVATDEPHAEDRNLADNSARVRWVPTDAKPGSEPSSVNLGKEGAVPVSILGTPEFNPRLEVVQSSLRYGVTGFEPSLLGCGGAPEDTNGDGFFDLVCRFDAKLAALTCTTTHAILTGRLADGTPFESQDPVKVVGCRK